MAKVRQTTMHEKFNAQKSFAFMLLSISFFLSLLVTPEKEGGIELQWHSGVLVNFVLSVIYLVIIGREAKFRGWSFFGSLLVLLGTFLGVLSIANVILINPFKGYGLLYAFLAELFVIINFRNLFMPFTHKGRQLTLNLLIAVLFCVIFKLAVMADIVPLLGINSIMAEYLTLPLMTAIWLASLSIAFLGLYFMKLAIAKENLFYLERAKNELGLDKKHMLLLNLDNEDLIGLNVQEIEDQIHKRLRNIIDVSIQARELQNLAKQMPNPNNSWVAPIIHHSI